MKQNKNKKVCFNRYIISVYETKRTKYYSFSVPAKQYTAVIYNRIPYARFFMRIPGVKLLKKIMNRINYNGIPLSETILKSLKTSYRTLKYNRFLQKPAYIVFFNFQDSKSCT